MGWIQSLIQLRSIRGETLNQMKTIAEHEDGKPRAFRLALDKFQQLLAGIGLILLLAIDQIEQQNIERASFWLGCYVDKCVRRQGWKFLEKARV